MHTYIATIHLLFSCSTLKYAYIAFSMPHINKLIGLGLVAQNLPLICPHKVLHIIYFIHTYMYMCIIIIICSYVQLGLGGITILVLDISYRKKLQYYCLSQFL